MKVHWLIDPEMFPAYRDDLVSCIRRQGHEAVLIKSPSPPFRWDDADNGYRRAVPEDACVVCHGDIELITRIGRERRWTPGTYATIEHFYCSNYFCHFGKFLLHREYAMLPFGELRRCREFLFSTLGRNGRIFVRPDSPLKLFTGQLATIDRFDADVEYMGFYEFPPESLVVVSTPRSIEAEWRFVVVRGQVVGGSQYKQSGRQDLQTGYPAAAQDLAVAVAQSGYEPDPVWVLDICRTDDGAYHLLEIGGFSFADLYLCDKQAVVAAISQAAWDDWQCARSSQARV